MELTTVMRRLLTNQRGAFSPYMFGILVGLSIFSTISAHYARKELVEAERRKLEQQQAEANDLRDALEIALLTETDSSYSADLTLNRAKPHTTLSTAKTRGGSDVTLNIVDATTGLGGIQNERVLITTTDDDLTTAAVGAANTAGDQASFSVSGSQPVAMFDTGAARNRQVNISMQNMEMEAAQIYSFYAGNLRFPSAAEYADIQAYTGLKDFWGNDFTYTIVASPTHVRIEFTTPWSYTERIEMEF